MQFLLDMVLHEPLPVHEIFERNDIPAGLFFPSLLGRLAQDSAESFDDADPMR